jgi:hypothetical protein
MKSSIYTQGLDKNSANYVAQSPLTFIERAATVYPNRPAVIHGDIQRNWAQTYERCRQFASTLTEHGIKRFDTVAVMLPNIPAMVEAHFAVPMTGAVLCALNTRLDAAAIAFMLEHGEAVLMTILGGIGTLWGPVAGAAVIINLQNYLANLGGWSTIATGAIFVICVLAFRRGIIGEIAYRLKIKL